MRYCRKRKLFLIIHELSAPAQTAVNGSLCRSTKSFGRRRSRSPYDARPSLSAAAGAAVTRPVTRFDVSTGSDASSRALSGFGLKLEHYVRDYALNRPFDCGAIVPLFLGQVAPDH
jgi:hypothetical protein